MVLKMISVLLLMMITYCVAADPINCNGNGSITIPNLVRSNGITHCLDVFCYPPVAECYCNSSANNETSCQLIDSNVTSATDTNGPIINTSSTINQDNLIQICLSIKGNVESTAAPEVQSTYTVTVYQSYEYDCNRSLCFECPDTVRQTAELVITVTNNGSIPSSFQPSIIMPLTSIIPSITSIEFKPSVVSPTAVSSDTPPPSSSSDGFPVWAIVLVAVCGLVILIVVCVCGYGVYNVIQHSGEVTLVSATNKEYELQGDPDFEDAHPAFQ